jgi:predicted RNA-binding Zn ribbon-like protein
MAILRPVRAKKMAREERFQFIGHYSCLDFVNTEFTKLNSHHGDALGGFSDLMEWLLESQLVNEKQVRHALKSWGHGEASARVYRDALAMRAALREMAEQLADRRPVPRRSLEAINKTIRNCPGRVLLARSSGRFEETNRLDLGEPNQLMVPIAQSASDLLCHGDVALVKRCANPACRVFFYDTSKNHTRRWCSTTGCGNRMRVAAHYRRRRATAHLV